MKNIIFLLDKCIEYIIGTVLLSVIVAILITAFTDAHRTAFEKAKHFAENADSGPLAIFGGTAAGKTHLLYSVKNAIKQNNPELTVILPTTADMRSALADILNSGGTSEQFREKYLQADVLLVDDIQELAGKEAIQNKLILIFNSFYESGKRFMMTSSHKEAGYGDGILFIPLQYHAGTDDSLEIMIDEFDEWFQKFCEGYQRSKRRMRRLHWRFD